MDKREKMDYDANGKVIFWAANLVSSQRLKISDSISQRIKSILGVKNSELS
jgi:hypothetical protein